MNPSPVYPAGPFHPENKPVSDSSSLFPKLADPEKNVISVPRTVPLNTVPKPRRGTYQDDSSRSSYNDILSNMSEKCNFKSARSSKGTVGVV